MLVLFGHLNKNQHTQWGARTEFENHCSNGVRAKDFLGNSRTYYSFHEGKNVGSLQREQTPKPFSPTPGLGLCSC
ncbi:hypothetical protein GJAV_G00148860 [Gymnothorax javanicus]|nr:hypothetical protein GJAV_G00148860 [Gymnothorax javanicus]